MYKIHGGKADIFLAMCKATEMYPVISKFVLQDSHLFLQLLLGYP